MKNHNIRFSKDLEWLIPFVESAKDLVPLRKVTSIKSFRVPKNKKVRTEASLVKQDDKFSINIRAYDYEPKDNTYKPHIIAEILDSLAHELSHVVHWEHTHDHFRLQANVLLNFADVLYEEDIVDTGHRFKRGSK